LFLLTTINQLDVLLGVVWTQPIAMSETEKKQ
jgi:hypothetical protein